MKKIMALTIFVIGMVACNSGESTRKPLENIRATPRPAPTSYAAVLVCEGCQENVPVGVWEEVTSGGLVGSVPSNTPCTVLDSGIFGGERWYKVRAKGLVGWVDGRFVQ